MKKIINIKKLTLVISIITSMGIINSAQSEEIIKKETVQIDENKELTNKSITLNKELENILKTQKNAQELLNDPNLSLESTLGDFMKYSALTATQEAKNKLEETARKLNENSYNQFDNENNNQTQNLRERSTMVGNEIKTEGKEIKNNNEIKATAVYTLGTTGYAEIIYNGSKSVVRQGDKLPNGEIVESLTPLSVVIREGKEKKILPIVSDDSMGINSTKPAYTLTAPKCNNKNDIKKRILGD